MTRELVVGAAQLGPVARAERRSHVVDRLIDLLHRGHRAGCELVVFPELALTTFFPRWCLDDGAVGGIDAISGDTNDLDSFYERSMPN
jgi:predicted amidohydrolase